MWTVHVRYFASLREALGEGEQALVPEGSPMAALRDQLMARSAAHEVALSRQQLVRCAVNLTLCDESMVLSDGAEVAFFPPVTGG